MSVTYKGRTYPTIAALAIAYGLTADACASRLRRGRPLEEPLRTVLPVSYAGHKYPSIRALARALRWPYTTVLRRRRRGAPLDPAVRLSKSFNSRAPRGARPYPLTSVSEIFQVLRSCHLCQAFPVLLKLFRSCFLRCLCYLCHVFSPKEPTGGSLFASVAMFKPRLYRPIAGALLTSEASLWPRVRLRKSVLLPPRRKCSLRHRGHERKSLLC